MSSVTLSFAVVTLLAASLSVVTARAVMFRVCTLFATNLPDVTASATSLSVVTPPAGEPVLMRAVIEHDDKREQ